MSDIGARFVACKGWRWLPGMIANGRNHGGSKRSGVVTEVVNGRPNVVTNAGDDVLLVGAEPDTSAPSTLGCILALVREARNDPTICVVWREGRRNGVVLTALQSHRVADWNHDLRTEPGGPFLSEADALLAALEAAP